MPYKPRPVNCAFCGAAFVSADWFRQRFCSKTCAAKARAASQSAKGMSKVCARCGAQFLAGSNVARYCSPKCRDAAYREQNRDRMRELRRLHYLRQVALAKPHGAGEEQECSRCGKRLPATTEFFFRGNGRFGLQTVCKVCRGAPGYGHHRPNRTIVAKPGYRICSACHRELRLCRRNFGRSKSRQGGYEYVCKRCKAKRQAIYDRAKPERIIVKRHRRMARVAGLPATLTAAEWHRCKEHFGNACAYCGRPMKRLQVDHVVPVVNGGGLNAENVVPACPRCNRSKWVRPMEAWFREQPFFSEKRLKKILAWIAVESRQARLPVA